MQSELHADCGTRVEPVPSRRVVLVPGSPDDTPRSIQDRSCASNRFSVLAESDAEDGQPQHHDIGTPPLTADEGDIENNDTASLVGQFPSREGPRRQDTDESHSGEENQNCDAMSASVMWQGSEVSTDDIPVPLSEPDVDVRGAHAGSPEIRAAFVFLDTIDLRTTFARRASVMKSIPHWLKGPFRNALKLAMEEAIRRGVLHQERGWKLFLLIPRLLLHRPPRGGLVPKSKLVQRFDDFARGDWEKLFQSSDKCDEKASRAYTRKRRRQKPEDDITRRAARALALVQMGELSAGRQALEGADLAPGNMETLRELHDPVRRPARIRQPLPPQVTDHMPDRPFEYRFAQVLRSSRKGAAAGPSGMTADHLRPVLENPRDTHLLFIRLGRLTALQKSSGGGRGDCRRRYSQEDCGAHHRTADQFTR